MPLGHHLQTSYPGTAPASSSAVLVRKHAGTRLLNQNPLKSTDEILMGVWSLTIIN